MGWRFRKSVKLAPGVKLNFGKKSVGVSVGGRYSGVSINSKTGVTTRASIPGTGISYTQKVGGGRGGSGGAASRRTSRSASGATPPEKKPPVVLRPWYIILAALLVVGGLGNLPDLGPAVLGVASGGVMLLFTVKKRRELSGAGEADEIQEPMMPAAPAQPKADEAQEPTTPSAEPEYPIEDPLPVKLSISIDLAERERPKAPASNVELVRIDDRSIPKLKDYYILDTETTGRDRSNDQIVELAWIKVQGGEVVDQWDTLVNPGIPISPAASRVNGIYDADVVDAPTYEQIRPRVADELLGAVVVGHNIQFDLRFIQRLLKEQTGTITYLDTLTLSRSLFKDLKSHALAELCKSLELPVQSSHRALQDVEATHALLLRCQEELLRKKQEEKERKAREKAERAAKYGASPLFDFAFVYTGDFSVSRENMEEMARSVGANPRQNVNSRTDYLVVGDLSNREEWVIERKLRKAEELISQGEKVRKINEQEYFDLITQAKSVLQN